MSSTPDLPIARKPSRGLRFRLKSILLAMLIFSIIAGWVRDRHLLNQAREIGRIRIEVYTDPRAFSQRLGRPMQVVDFDDIDTELNDVAPFESDRYQSLGAVIVGADGQYVGRTFGQPRDFTAASQPNAYAPGPVGKNPGGNSTDVTFLAGQSRGLVCGFGLNFIDVDYRMIMPSGLELYDRYGNLLATYNSITGPNRTPVFRGIVAVDETGNPVPVIERVRLTNGTGWPGVDAGETVTMDDFAYDVPVPVPRQ
jgi:hypothetical protein